MGVVQVLGVVLLVLAACMTAVAEVLLTRANPEVYMPPLWGNASKLQSTPIAARVSVILAFGSAILGAASLDLSIWWGAALVFAVGTVPFNLIRVSVYLHRRLRTSREGVQHGG